MGITFLLKVFQGTNNVKKVSDDFSGDFNRLDGEIFG